MSKTENTFNPTRCIFCLKEKFCKHAKHENHNKGICVCEENKCPLIVPATNVADPTPSPSPKELTDEIRAFRQKNKEFQATNDHETYLIVSFSTKEDKKIFLKNIGFENNHTLVNGYELAKNIGKEPTRPAFKLREPLDK